MQENLKGVQRNVFIILETLVYLVFKFNRDLIQDKLNSMEETYEI